VNAGSHRVQPAAAGRGILGRRGAAGRHEVAVARFVFVQPLQVLGLVNQDVIKSVVSS